MSGHASLNELISANVVGELRHLADSLRTESQSATGPNRATVWLTCHRLEQIADGIHAAQMEDL